MYFADFISQPDHSMATIFGLRDYGIGGFNNIIYGFEWVNLIMNYTIKHRGPGGSPPWYSRELYNYSSFNGRRWGAHSGGDSDDWLIYAGYIKNRSMFLLSINYERHGVLLHRPAEVKFELGIDLRIKFANSWLGIYYEKQNEMFLGFPDYFYEDNFGNPIDSSTGKLANSRITNTIIFSLNKEVNF